MKLFTFFSFSKSTICRWPPLMPGSLVWISAPSRPCSSLPVCSAQLQQLCLVTLKTDFCIADLSWFSSINLKKTDSHGIERLLRVTYRLTFQPSLTHLFCRDVYSRQTGVLIATNLRMTMLCHVMCSSCNA